MRKLVAALVMAMILSISLAVGVAQARTPTPTATMLPLPSPTPSPTATPTIPPDQIAVFRAHTWVDAHLVGAPIVAKIGDTDCGQSVPVAIVCDPISCGPVQDIPVVSSSIKPGCGFDGAQIAFFVGGKPALPTVAWHAGRGPFLELVAGFPFASVDGTFFWPGQLPWLDRNDSEAVSVLIPYIGNTACGYDHILTGEWGTTGWIKNRYEYSLIVYSNEQRVGCGYEGAPITFKVVDGQGNVLATAEGKGVWRACDGTAHTAEELDLTLVTPGGIRIGNVGTGDSHASDGAPTGVMLGLAFSGMVTFVAGATLRKITT
jgi:hypothetical protein